MFQQPVVQESLASKVKFIFSRWVSLKACFVFTVIYAHFSVLTERVLSLFLRFLSRLYECNKLINTERTLVEINPYPANVDNMASSYQC
jgi:hypothetical protein